MIDYKTKYFKDFNDLYNTVRSLNINIEKRPVSIAWMIGLDAALSTGTRISLVNVLLGDHPFTLDLNSLAANDYITGFFSARSFIKTANKSSIVSRINPSDYPHV
jgi:hypothetical protein